MSPEAQSVIERRSTTLHLPKSAAALGTDAFAATLTAELTPLLATDPLLATAAEQGGLIDAGSLSLTLLSSRGDVEAAEIAVGIFLVEVIGGCSCGDEPFSAQRYLEYSLRLQRSSGTAELRLRGD